MKTGFLDHLRVASPCQASWESMQGNMRVRYCELCKLNVYNFAELTPAEVTSLIARTEGRLCGRLYRRADGTVITKDCPVGLSAIRKRVARITATAFAALVTLTTSVFAQKQDKSSCRRQVTITRESTQNPTGASALTGKVFDLNGALIAKAEITVTREGIFNPIKTESDAEGKFLVAGLAAGTYKITIESPGFKKLQMIEVKVASNETVSLEAIMEMSSASVTMGIIVL
ncbi:MAG TPA: carboxypeptidase-like regulatory domain-containing protein, partial [Pyrinomonadaceae bacterium]|nr:carboxypeptidase-like regulatory domain-containing protein [Pyrinomonadaceae bacterium]